MHKAMRILFAGAAVLFLAGPVSAQDVRKSHGLSAFGDLKYGPDFTNFDYVNPDAPRRGVIRLPGIDSFDSLNAFILKGVPVAGIGLIHASLMERALDEPDAMYGYVAESVEMPADRSWIIFNLRAEAIFHDGSAITADDVVFTFKELVKSGHPQYRIIFAGVDKVEAITPRRVRFTFKEANNRDLPLQIAALSVLSKKYYQKADFTKTTLTAPMGAGPYQVEKVEAGRSVTYRRNLGHWSDKLAIMRGRYNFERIRFIYFRDRDIAFQAFFADAYDFREEFTSRSWATQYDNKKPIKDGRIKRETLSDETPSGVQAFFLNLRRKKFQDRRVREAIDLAFDFEWTNKALFYSLYKRTNSMFANSPLAAEKPPSAAELALLEPWRGKIPDDVFRNPYRSPVADGTGRNRPNLRKAMKLLVQAGWRIENNQLIDKAGKPFEMEFLLFESSFQRIISPFIRNLRRLGIQATIRIVDVANYQHRMQQYDFDAIVQRYVQRLTPGIEQRAYYGSKFANVPGQRNLAGIKNPAIDALIEKVIAAPTRMEMVTAVRALDRVLMWNRYIIPQWYKGSHNIAYWRRFDRPKIKPRFDLGMLDSWWYNPDKAVMLKK